VLYGTRNLKIHFLGVHSKANAIWNRTPPPKIFSDPYFSQCKIKCTCKTKKVKFHDFRQKWLLRLALGSKFRGILWHSFYWDHNGSNWPYPKNYFSEVKHPIVHWNLGSRIILLDTHRTLSCCQKELSGSRKDIANSYS